MPPRYLPDPTKFDAEAKPREITLAQKAAIIITALGPKDAEPLLRELSEDDVRAFARASQALEDVPRMMFEETVREFIDALDDKSLSLSTDRLKAILASVMSDDAIERILEDMEDNDGRSIWEKLSQSEPAELSNYLVKEHPQTVAVVLSRIRPEMAAKVMQRLEPAFCEEVIMRLSNVAMLSGSVMEAVKTSIEGEFLRSARQRKSKRKPDELIGSIFNHLTTDVRETLMGGLEARAPQLAQAVQRKMFTFNDIVTRVDRAAVSAVVREIDNDLLLKALAAAKRNAPETRDFILDNISKRLGEQLRDQIEDMPTPGAREGEEAQFEVVSIIRRMGERGVIELLQPEEDDLLDD